MMFWAHIMTWLLTNNMSFTQDYFLLHRYTKRWQKFLQMTIRSLPCTWLKVNVYMKKQWEACLTLNHHKNTKVNILYWHCFDTCWSKKCSVCSSRKSYRIHYQPEHCNVTERSIKETIYIAIIIRGKWGEQYQTQVVLKNCVILSNNY